MLDDVLKILQAGQKPKKRANLRGAAARKPATSPLTFLQEFTGDGGETDVGDMARGVLAALQAGEFRPDDIVPIPMPTSPTRRRPATRLKSTSLEQLEHLVNNPDLLKSPELDDGSEGMMDFGENGGNEESRRSGENERAS
jgi:hypothetical protein